MEPLILFFASFLVLWLLVGSIRKSGTPKALNNKYIRNPQPLYPTHTKESVGWTVLRFLFGMKKDLPTTHGSATFISQKELQKLLHKKNKGMVVDGVRRLPLDSTHYCIVGGSGSGKTSKVLIPNILNAKGVSSLVISDPSKEVFRTCAQTLSRNGYQVLVLSLEEGPTLCFNPLSRAQSSKDVMKVAELIVGVSDNTDGSARFWMDGATTIVSLVIKSLKSTSHGNLANVRYLLNLYNPTDNRVLDHFMEVHLTNPVDLVEYKGFMANEAKIVSGFISQAKMSLKSLLDDHLARLTSSDSIDFHALRRSKTALFIQYPENQTAYYSFIIKIFYTQLFDMCMRTGLNGKDARHVMVHLDEFANIGAIPHFSNLITTLRKRNVCVNIYVQALEQIEQVYPRRSESILYGGINTHLYLNSLSQQTCEQISRRIGSFTVEDAEKGHRHARSLMAPNELRLMDNNTALMLYKNHKPALFRTTPYYQNKALMRQIKQSKTALPLNYPALPDVDFVSTPPPPSSSGSGSSDPVFDI